MKSTRLSDLLNPRGLTVDSLGRILVSEGGSGGSDCTVPPAPPLIPPVTNRCWGQTGAVVRYDPGTNTFSLTFTDDGRLLGVFGYRGDPATRTPKISPIPWAQAACPARWHRLRGHWGEHHQGCLGALHARGPADRRCPAGLAASQAVATAGEGPEAGLRRVSEPGPRRLGIGTAGSCWGRPKSGRTCSCATALRSISRRAWRRWMPP
jgi:hypothetical protein